MNQSLLYNTARAQCVIVVLGVAGQPIRGKKTCIDF